MDKQKTECNTDNKSKKMKKIKLDENLKSILKVSTYNLEYFKGEYYKVEG